MAARTQIGCLINSEWRKHLIDYRGFYTHLVDHAKAGISAGQSVEEALSS